MAKGLYRDWLTKDGLTVLRGWARDGLTDEQIAKNIGIARGTLYEWKKRYPDIDDALKRGKDVIDAEVEEALIKAALGYKYQETESFAGDDGKQHEKIITRTAKPNVTALIFWLKNRRPDKWRDLQNIDLKTEVDIEESAKKYQKYLDELCDEG